MDFRLLTVFFLVVAVSGCIGGGDDAAGEDGKGLVVKSIDVTDRELRPGQSTGITMVLENRYHEEVDFQQIALHSTGILEVRNNGIEECTASSLEPTNQGVVDRIECSWMLDAPEEVDFGSQSVSFNIYQKYSTTVSNSNNPLSISFMPDEEVTTTSTVSRSFSNGDISVSIEGTDPSFAGGDSLEVSISPSGNGEVFEDYRVQGFPESAVDCPEKVEEEFEGGTSFVCDMSSGVGGSERVDRQVSVSVSYLYGRSKSISVEVVDG